MRQIFQVIIIGAVACLIAFPILVYMGINTPLPFTDWGHQIVAFFSGLKLDKITTSFWALIGGTGAATGAAGALAYIYTKTKGALKQTQTSLTATQDQAQTYFNQKETLTQANAELQENSNTVMKQFSTEKEQLTTQVEEYKSKALTLEDQIKRQAIEKEVLVKQNIANFTEVLPGNSIAMDPSTGNIIKTVTKIQVK